MTMFLCQRQICITQTAGSGLKPMTVSLIIYSLFNIRFFVSCTTYNYCQQAKKETVGEKNTVQKSFLITNKWYKKDRQNILEMVFGLKWVQWIVHILWQLNLEKILQNLHYITRDGRFIRSKNLKQNQFQPAGPFGVQTVQLQVLQMVESWRRYLFFGGRPKVLTQI